MHYWKVDDRTNASTETQAMNIEDNYSKSFDDDGRLKRTGKYHILLVLIN